MFELVIKKVAVIQKYVILFYKDTAHHIAFWFENGDHLDIMLLKTINHNGLLSKTIPSLVWIWLNLSMYLDNKSGAVNEELSGNTWTLLKKHHSNYYTP